MRHRASRRANDFLPDPDPERIIGARFASIGDVDLEAVVARSVDRALPTEYGRRASGVREELSVPAELCRGRSAVGRSS